MTSGAAMRTIALALAAATCLAGTTDDRIPDSRYLDYARGFAPYTARIRVQTGDRTSAIGTATLIDDHWAITAAHVVAGGEIVTVGGLAATDVIVHEEYSDDAHGMNDIALVRTEESFDLDFYPPLSDGEKEGQTVSIAGFGITGRLSSGYTTSDDKLRAGTNTIERFERTIIVCKATPRSSPLEICIAPGDSGGPLFCDGKLAGINSFTMADRGPLRSRSGEESGHTRVSLFRDWIRRVMESRR